MENWEMDFYWLKVRHYLQEVFKTSSLPDLEAVLFLIGIQELDKIQTKFKKEEKMQLMHDGAARLWMEDGYFSLEGKDDNGWPIWKNIKEIEMEEKEKMDRLKELVIDYFEDIFEEV